MCFIEFYCVLVQEIYFIYYFEDISLQISSFAIKQAVLSAACTVAFLKQWYLFHLNVENKEAHCEFSLQLPNSICCALRGLFILGYHPTVVYVSSA